MSGLPWEPVSYHGDIYSECCAWSAEGLGVCDIPADYFGQGRWPKRLGGIHVRLRNGTLVIVKPRSP